MDVCATHTPLALCALLASGALHAADAGGERNDEAPLEEVTVVGSHIAGGGAAEALSVATVGKDEIDSIGATNGNELFRSLPQFGDVAFTEKSSTNQGRNSNAPRGDVSSINLRNLGSVYTLLLINGRRTVQHPISSGAATSYNANAMPTFGLDRIDLLLDGGAAVYGSDAVAGVVNLVTPSNRADSGGVKLQYGSVQSGHREDASLEGFVGKDFADGRGNVSVQYEFAHRTAQLNSDQWFTATDGRRELDDGTFVLDPTATPFAQTFANTAWGAFQRYNNGVPVGPAYYINQQGQLVTGAVPTSLRPDARAEPGVTETPAIKRGNLFATARFDLTDNLEVFGELGYFKSKAEAKLSGEFVTLGGVDNYIHIRPDAYWVPEALRQGADAIRLTNYYVADYGLRRLDVDNDQSRALAGLRGSTDGGWRWESALLYSRAQTTDVQEGGIATAFSEAVNRTDASAYNPFNGGNPANPRIGDATPSDATSFIQPTTREGTSELALWDFKIDRPDAFAWYAGDIGVAAGVEYRYESRVDDRDENIDGTVQYVDWYTGKVAESNFFTHSASPDIEGSRNVKSVFAELAVPLVSPEHGIPLIKSFDAQLAGRYEDYSDAGDVAKPKLAVAWRMVDSLLLRGSLSGGFRAPGLELANSGTIWRFGGSADPVRCVALVRRGVFTNYNTCISNAVVRYQTNTATTYGDDVEPETTKQSSYGFVFEPEFLPEGAGRISLGVDVWKVEVENPIGTIGSGNELLYDAYLRVVEGTSNPLVVRAAPTASDIAQFEGSGLDPVGAFQYVETKYGNLQPLTVSGVDFSLSWRLPESAWGSFALLVNVSQLKEYKQQKSLEEQAIAAAISSGQLDIVAQGLGAANEVGLNGQKPEWRGSAALIWSYADWTVRLRDNYIGSVISGAYGDGRPYVVDATHRWALSVQKEFKQGLFEGSAVEVGSRNLFDEEPPLGATPASTGSNYLSSLHESFGRYLYLNVSKGW
ncbi:MAG TPA: TonB-dependent receptor plug domain-containing protein [Steroidobacter sp.]|uniref:TonB-dependent receptor plug domain-containing protein n=1 Tax=Steroidobacter sp. TaxID=1978227 RepID=UPI002ED837B3